MDVTIIGAGDMALGIGARVVAGGNSVTVLGRTEEKVEALAEQLRARTRHGATVEIGTIEDPITGEIVVLAVPYPAAVRIVEELREQLAGKVVIDITNPVDWESLDRLVTPAGSSAAEQIAMRADPTTRLVKAFNTTFAQPLVEGETAAEPLEVFIAGDDDDAKRKVARLVEAGALRTIDAGPLRRSRQLEELGFLHITLQDRLGSRFASAVKLVW